MVGRPPLLLAVRNGHDRVLIEHGDCVESKNLNGSVLPLLWAAGRGHKSVVKLLVLKGASLEYAGRNGQTALPVMCSRERTRGPPVFCKEFKDCIQFVTFSIVLHEQKSIFVIYLKF